MDPSRIVVAVMDEWKAGIDAHDPARVAAVFAEDAVFQGLRPYGIGRDAVADYYDSQPAGMTITYRVLESRSPADGVVLGYLAATFGYLDRPTVELAIGVVLTRFGDGWQLVQYQASSGVLWGANAHHGYGQSDAALTVPYRSARSSRPLDLNCDALAPRAQTHRRHKRT